MFLMFFLCSCEKKSLDDESNHLNNLDENITKELSFTETNNSFKLGSSPYIAIEDYDNDDDLDFIKIGLDNFEYFSKIYTNDGKGNFVNNQDLEVAVKKGSVSWGDYDNDGYVDVIISGSNSDDIGTPIPKTTLYKNIKGNFINQHINIAQKEGFSSFIDIDNNGQLDLLVLGRDANFSYTTKTYLNKEGDFIDLNNNIDEYSLPHVSVIDFNNDNFSDFFVLGRNLTTGHKSADLYINNKDCTFSKVNNNFIGQVGGTSSWADYDKDGDFDVVYNGVSNTRYFTLIYKNEGNAVFSPANADLPDSGEPGSVQWGDVDLDGDLDILISGPGIIMLNDGKGNFAEFITQNIDIRLHYPMWFLDADNDSDLDIISSKTIFKNLIIENQK